MQLWDLGDEERLMKEAEVCRDVLITESQPGRAQRARVCRFRGRGSRARSLRRSVDPRGELRRPLVCQGGLAVGVSGFRAPSGHGRGWVVALYTTQPPQASVLYRLSRGGSRILPDTPCHFYHRKGPRDEPAMKWWPRACVFFRDVWPQRVGESLGLGKLKREHW